MNNRKLSEHEQAIAMGHDTSDDDEASTGSCCPEVSANEDGTGRVCSCNQNDSSTRPAIASAAMTDSGSSHHGRATSLRGSTEVSGNDEDVATSGAAQGPSSVAPESKQASHADPLEDIGDPPRRPLNGYNYFFQEQRALVLQERDQQATESKLRGRRLFSAMGKTIAQRWNELTESQSRPYQELAEKDRMRYSNELAKYNHRKFKRIQEQAKRKALLASAGEIGLNTEEPVAVAKSPPSRTRKTVQYAKSPPAKSQCLSHDHRARSTPSPNPWPNTIQVPFAEQVNAMDFADHVSDSLSTRSESNGPSCSQRIMLTDRGEQKAAVDQVQQPGPVDSGVAASAGELLAQSVEAPAQAAGSTIPDVQSLVALLLLLLSLLAAPPPSPPPPPPEPLPPQVIEVAWNHRTQSFTTSRSAQHVSHTPSNPPPPATTFIPVEAQQESDHRQQNHATTYAVPISHHYNHHSHVPGRAPPPPQQQQEHGDLAHHQPGLVLPNPSIRVPSNNEIPPQDLLARLLVNYILRGAPSGNPSNH